MIVIADDDHAYSDQLKTILRLRGFHGVVAVATGKELVELVVEGVPPRVIILDMMLPYDDRDFEGAKPPAPNKEARGLKAARELHENGYDLASIIVITALSSRSDLAPVRKLGISSILTKPALTQDILRAVNRIYHGS